MGISTGLLFVYDIIYIYAVLIGRSRRNKRGWPKATTALIKLQYWKFEHASQTILIWLYTSILEIQHWEDYLAFTDLKDFW